MKYFYILIWVLLFAACKSGKEKEITKIPIEFKTQNLYKQLSAVDTNNLPEEIQKLEKQYGEFLPFFLKNIVSVDHTNGYQSENLRMFFTHKDFRQLFDTVNKNFPETKSIDKELKSLFQHIKYYDTQIVIPNNVIYYVAGLGEAAFTRDRTLGIGLDMYLGKDFGPYKAIQRPEYLTQHYIPKNIPLNAAKVMYNNIYGTDIANKTLLDLMIDEGKRNLFLSKVLPEFSEADILGYNEEQINWVNENEEMIYNFFVQQKLLYENSPMKTMRYIAPAPTSMGMPGESPGYTGGYIGLQILKSYEKKSGLSLQEILMDKKSSQEILRISKYKPRK